MEVTGYAHAAKWVCGQAFESGDWVDSLVNSVASNNPAASITAAHANFERTHPFLDGNGLTGRLLLNLRLIRLGYPPPSSTPATTTGNSAPWREPTTAIRGPSGNSSPGQ